MFCQGVGLWVCGLGAAGGAYQFNGVSQPEVAYKANAIRTTARGVRHVSFPDGQRIEVSYPYYILRGAPPGTALGSRVRVANPTAETSPP